MQPGQIGHLTWTNAGPPTWMCVTDGSESIPRGKQKLHTGGGMTVTPSLSLFISTVQ